MITSSITKALTALSLSAISFVVSAQPDKPYDFMVEGVKVIVQPSGNEIMEIRTIIKGGVQNYSFGKDGIETLAINALTECGTEKDDKNTFKNKLDKISAQVYGYTGLDYASFNLNCIKSDFDVVWPLYVDALTIPKFDHKEFDRIKQDAINYLKDQGSIPNYGMYKFARQTAFEGKNYAKLPEGSEETVSKITVEETKSYYKNLLTKSRIFFVVVGEIDRADLEKRISGLLSLIPAGKPIILKKELYLPVKNSFKAEKKDFPTNYLQAIGSAPIPGSDDYDAFNLAMRIFSDRQSLEVKTNNGLSPTSYSYVSQGFSSYTNTFVSTKEPNKYIDIIHNVINDTKRNGFKEDELKDMKTTYLTSYYYGQETNASQAWSLAFNEAIRNDWRHSLTLNNDVKAVKVSDLNKAFNKYMNNLTWVYQGDPGKVDSKLFLNNNNVKTKLSPSKLDTKTKN